MHHSVNRCFKADEIKRMRQQKGTSGANAIGSRSIRDRIRELRRVPVQQLVSHPKNWRLHPRAQKDAFAALRSEIGFAGVLLVRDLKDGRYQILDGHMRAAMTPDGLIPVVVLDLTDAEAEKLLLTYDPLAALAETDFERLKALLETVQTDSEAVQELLRRTAGDPLWAVLHPEELKPAEVAPDRAEELRAKWCTELGQIWQLGPHRLMCADSREKRNLQWLFNAARAIRLIVTDSPYGVSYASKNSYLNRSDRGTRIQKPIRNDSLAPNEIRDLFQASLQGAIAFALPGAACYASVPWVRCFLILSPGLRVLGSPSNIFWCGSNSTSSSECRITIIGTKPSCTDGSKMDRTTLSMTGPKIRCSRSTGPWRANFTRPRNRSSS